MLLKCPIFRRKNKKKSAIAKKLSIYILESGFGWGMQLILIQGWTFYFCSGDFKLKCILIELT